MKMHWIGWLGFGVAMWVIVAGLVIRIIMLVDPWREWSPWDEDEH